jgi:hypothetical protein
MPGWKERRDRIPLRAGHGREAAGTHGGYDPLAVRGDRDDVRHHPFLFDAAREAGGWPPRLKSAGCQRAAYRRIRRTRWPAHGRPPSDVAALVAPLDDSVAVGADGGAGTVVLKRAGSAGPRTGGRRCGVDDRERECEGKNSPGQHDHSPGDEALSGFCRQDRGVLHLFPHIHSNAVRREQVRVSAMRAAVHIAVIRRVTAS